ncbi:MAG: hypothetical protein JXA36_04570 [Coriobacteriia bacterium]|nr:hypothetical protein [Coriobacteriia bacterium]
MMISNQQIRLAAEYRASPCGFGCSGLRESRQVSPEFLERMVTHVRELPDVREDRVAHGRVLVEYAMPSSGELAAKLIGRLVSDSIR